MRPPRLAKNGPDAGRARLGDLNENAFMFMRDHFRVAMEDGSNRAMGRPGLEPGTNPESFRGCSYSADSSVSFNLKIASCGFFFRLSSSSSARPSVIEGIRFAAMRITFSPRRRVV